MAYTSEPISPQTTSSNASVSTSPTMREERTIDPYQHINRLANATEKTGQLDVISDASKKAAESKPTEESVILSPQMAALARKEQKFRQEQQALKKQQEAIEAERAEIAELKALKVKLAAKDYSDIEKLVPYDEYTNHLIEKQNSSTPEQQALKKLEAELDSVKKAQQDDVSKRFEEAVNQRRQAVNVLVEANDEYSSVKELKMQEAVVQHILDTWEHDNIELTPEQAAKEVEELLLEKASKWTSLSKIKGKSESVDEKKQLPPLKQGIKTLTNNMTVSDESKRPKKSFQGMSDSERYAEARRRAEEKLKN